MPFQRLWKVGEFGLTLEIAIDSESSMRSFAGRLARMLIERNDSGVIALRGALGAGKTTFVQGFVKALPGGDNEYVSSPTYAIAQQYETNPPVHHFDLFRIEESQELEFLDFRTLFYSRGFCLVEWPERAEDRLPESRIEVRIEVVSDEARSLVVQCHGDMGSERMLALEPPP